MLSKFIAPENIPKKYGGELEFSWGDKPVLDPFVNDVVDWCDGFTDFPTGPIFWRDLGDGTLECLAVGSVDKVDRVQRVCTIKKTCGSHPMPEREPMPKEAGVSSTEIQPRSTVEEGARDVKGLKIESDSGSDERDSRVMDEKMAAELTPPQIQPQAVGA